jgi:metal-responsive CopG/Arc/MetJ family transcriptional regulator
MGRFARTRPKGARMREREQSTVTSITLPTQLLKRVNVMARRRDQSMAAAVRAALRYWLAALDEGQR